MAWATARCLRFRQIQALVPAPAPHRRLVDESESLLQRRIPFAGNFFPHEGLSPAPALYLVPSAPNRRPHVQHFDPVNSLRSSQLLGSQCNLQLPRFSFESLVLAAQDNNLSTSTTSALHLAQSPLKLGPAPLTQALQEEIKRILNKEGVQECPMTSVSGLISPAQGELLPQPPTFRMADVKREVKKVRDAGKQIRLDPNVLGPDAGEAVGIGGVERFMAAQRNGMLPSVCTFTVHDTMDGMTCASFSQDSMRMAVGVAESYISLWNLKGEKLRGMRSGFQVTGVKDASSFKRLQEKQGTATGKLIIHSGPVYTAAFDTLSPSPRYLLSCSADTTTRLWSLDTLTNVAVYRGHQAPVWDVQWTGVSGGGSPLVQETEQQDYGLLSAVYVSILTDCISQPVLVAGLVVFGMFKKGRAPDGRYLASAAKNLSINLWDLSSGKRIKKMTGHTGAIHSLSFSAESNVLASGGGDWTVGIWALAPHIAGMIADDASYKADTCNACPVHTLKPVLDGWAIPSITMLQNMWSLRIDTSGTPGPVSSDPSEVLDLLYCFLGVEPVVGPHFHYPGAGLALARHLTALTQRKPTMSETRVQREFLTPRCLIFNIIWYSARIGTFAYGWLPTSGSQLDASHVLCLEFSWCWFGPCSMMASFFLPILCNLIRIISPKLTWLMPADENIWFHCQVHTTAHHKVRKQCFEAFWCTHHLAFFFMLGLFTHATGCFVQDSAEPDLILTFPFYSTNQALFRLPLLREVRMRRATTLQKLFPQAPEISKFQWHPFTITTAPEDPDVSVHIRQVGDWTQALSERLGAGPNTQSEALSIIPEGRSEFIEVDSTGVRELPMVRIDGPYGATAEDVFESEVAILIGTGISVTPFVSIHKHIWYCQRRGNLGTLRRVEFFWICHDAPPFWWFQALLQEVEATQTDPNCLRINIFLTQKFGEDILWNIASVCGQLRMAIETGQYLPDRESALRTKVGTFFYDPSTLAKAIKQGYLAINTDTIDFFVCQGALLSTKAGPCRIRPPSYVCYTVSCLDTPEMYPLITYTPPHSDTLMSRIRLHAIGSISWHSGRYAQVTQNWPQHATPLDDRLAPDHTPTSWHP
ncbi:NADPH oxidase isoform 1 [Ceratobasidium theobromae]|uniref:NADPH oxidase isoform 1 n=1 Tax=Ceratobasidium theobromae TaxID=1582974 RepID=A0A5N5QA58_9AGAM|nr:NADPH oxidase isoform 1 [Ceratobasidium theobromae]